jgi:hypothetical protein
MESTDNVNARQPKSAIGIAWFTVIPLTGGALMNSHRRRLG